MNSHIWQRRRLQHFSLIALQIWRLGSLPKRASLPDRRHLAFGEPLTDPRIVTLAAQTGEHDANNELLTPVTNILRRHHESLLPVPGLVKRNTVFTIHAPRHTYDPSSWFESWISKVAWRRLTDACRPRASVLAFVPT